MSNTKTIDKPIHGGNLGWAVEQFQIPREQWVDLSSAVSPWPYHYVAINSALVQQLPYITAEFYQKASNYYGVSPKSILPLNGSQEAIAFLPLFYALTKGITKVLLPQIGYQEHSHHWQLANHHTCFYADEGEHSIDALIKDKSIKVCVVINPNNPTGTIISKEKINHWRVQLQQRGGWLIIDEAFIDVWPEKSMIEDNMPEGLIILRSTGKFFGLPGLRLGFLFAEQTFVNAIQQHIGLWNVSAHTLAVAEQLLVDKQWQKNQQIKIIKTSDRWYKKISKVLITLTEQITNNGLFISFLLLDKQGARLFNKMAEQGFLIRCYPENDNRVWVRFALPENETLEDKVVPLLKQFAKDEMNHHSSSSPS